jgi:hypothetical protein
LRGITFPVCQQSAENPGKTLDCEQRAAPGAAVNVKNAPIADDPPAVVDPHLAAVIVAWPQLSTPIREGILAMVNAVKAKP